MLGSAMFTVSGLLLASASKSAMLRYGALTLASTTIGNVLISATGSKSLSGSKDMDGYRNWFSTWVPLVPISNV